MKFFQKIQETAVNAKRKLVCAAAGAGMLALPGMSLAALSTEKQAMITVVTTKLDDLVGAVASIATSNLGLIAAMVVAGLIIMYMKTAGR